MLKTAAVLNFLLAAGHVLCLFRLDAAFRLYRIEPFMDRLAALWPPIPYLITLGVACGLTVCGLYALSAAGAIRPLPLLRYDAHAPEDVDTRQEDHIADEIRYLCQSDPIAPRPVVQRTPKVFDPLSSD